MKPLAIALSLFATSLVAAPAAASGSLPVTVHDGLSGDLAGMHGGMARFGEGAGWLRCSVRGDTARCQAVDAEGRYGSCATRDRAHLQTVRALSKTSFVRVWFERGTCTTFYVGQASWAAR